MSIYKYQMKRNSFITNPFIIYSLTWCIVLLVYQLEWSYIVPKLSVEYLLFLLFTIAISFFTGIIFYQKRAFIFYQIEKVNIKSLKRIFITLYFLLGIEIIYAGGIPLLGYIVGTKQLSYVDFGLPFVHIIITNSFLFLFIYIFHCYKSVSDKAIKRRLLLYIVLTVLPFILIFNRMGILECFVAGCIIHIMSARNALRSILKLFISTISILLLFGYAGNLRTDTAVAKNLILDIGEATYEFRNSIIPNELFWGYLYIASPLGNSQTNINQNPNIDVTTKDLESFWLFELTPEVISKRLARILELEDKESTLITSALNVSSVYNGAYKYLGWWGLIFMFFFMYFFILLSISMVPKNSPYYVTTIVIIDIVIIMNLFDNMFTFMGVIPQILIAIIFSFKYLLRKHGKKFCIIRYVYPLSIKRF